LFLVAFAFATQIPLGWAEQPASDGQSLKAQGDMYFWPFYCYSIRVSAKHHVVSLVRHACKVKQLLNFLGDGLLLLSDVLV